MRVSNYLALLSVLTLAGVAVSVPKALSDLSATSIKVSEHPTINPSVDEFSVTVQRVDELIGDNGDVLAARVLDVVFKFDVDNDKILVNGVPVELGVSSIEVDSLLIAGGQVADIPTQLLNSAFNHGIAKVEVHAMADKQLLPVKELVADPAQVARLRAHNLPDIVEVRRVTVRARVLEVDGHVVAQTDMVEQVMDVVAGYVLRGRPRTLPLMAHMAGANNHEGLSNGNHGHCLRHRRLAAMWRRLPHATRVAVATFLGSLILLVFFVALPLAMYVQWKERRVAYERVQIVEPLVLEEEDEEEQVNVVTEKTLLKEAGVY